MANGKLEGRRVAVLATDGFEQVELTKPVEALKAEGAQVEVVSPKGGRSRASTTTTRATASRSIASWPKPMRAATTQSSCPAG